MKKQTLITIGIILLVALICLVGLLVISHQQAAEMRSSSLNYIFVLLCENAGELASPESAAESIHLQMRLTALDGACEDLAQFSDFSYPPDATFRRLADRIAQGAYSQEELKQMGDDLLILVSQLNGGSIGICRKNVSYDELSKLLTDFLTKWVRGNS